jgi:hypothetical protein
VADILVRETKNIKTYADTVKDIGPFERVMEIVLFWKV